MPRNYQQLAPSVQFENQLASSLYSVGFILPGYWSTIGFITRDFHALISRQHSQTNRRGLYTLFLTSKSRCMQKISSVDALLSTKNVLSRSGRFGGGHTGWSQLQLASSVSPLCQVGPMNFAIWVVRKMAAIFSWPPCVNFLRPSDAYIHRWFMSSFI